MLQCPSCASRSIPLGSAWRSSVTHPARCAACGVTCYVRSSASGLPLLAALAIALAGTGLAAALQSLPVLALGVVAAGLGYGLLWRRIRPVAVIALPTPARGRATTGLALLEILSLLVLWK